MTVLDKQIIDKDSLTKWVIDTRSILSEHLSHFSPGTLVSSTNKTDRYDIADILLKVALNTIKRNQANLS